MGLGDLWQPDKGVRLAFEMGLNAETGRGPSVSHNNDFYG